MIGGPGGMSPGATTQAIFVKLSNISAVACAAQALGETPTGGVRVTSGRTSMRCGKDETTLPSRNGLSGSPCSKATMTSPAAE